MEFIKSQVFSLLFTESADPETVNFTFVILVTGIANFQHLFAKFLVSHHLLKMTRRYCKKCNMEVEGNKIISNGIEYVHEHEFVDAGK